MYAQVRERYNGTVRLREEVLTGGTTFLWCAHLSCQCAVAETIDSKRNHVSTISFFVEGSCHAAPPDLAISPIKIKKIKLAVDCRCEWCSNQYALPNLEIHHIPTGADGKEPAHGDLQKQILIVCSTCHRNIHLKGYLKELQVDVIRYRSRAVKKAIREILGYRPRPYIPPEIDDPAKIYEETSQPHWGWGT